MYVFTLVIAISCAANQIVYAEKCDKNSCDWNLWSHYEGKGCEPVMDKDLCCPKSFDCSKFVATVDKNKCIYKGRTYKERDTINTTNPCQSCMCGPKGAISCAVIDCFQERLDGNCLPLFAHSSCCPVSFKCVEGKSADDDKSVTCKHDGKTYYEGQLIDMPEDPCTKCICSSDFKDKNSPSCQRIECNFPANNQRLRDGCVPIYYEGQCCPIDWLCPPPDAPVSTSSSSNSCSFGGRSVNLGKILEHPDPCIRCSCSTPPDLTCVRRRCPPPEDFDTCRPLPPKEGVCCPEYDCSRA